MNGSPGAAPMPCAANVSIAERSSATCIHRLMPSVPVNPTLGGGEHRRDRAAPGGVLDASRGDRVDGGLMIEHLQQHRLQDAAAPPRPQQSPVGDGAHHIAGAADRRQAQIGAMALGVAADVHGALRQPLAQAHQCATGDVAGVVVLHHERIAVGEQRGQFVPALRRERDARRVVGPRLQEHGRGACSQGRGQAAGHHALLVEVDADHLRAEQIEQVEQRGEGGVLDCDPVAEPYHDARNTVERIHRAVDDGELLGVERPIRPHPSGQLRQHRLVEVAAGERLTADAGDHRAQVG